jgi:hypothetical protein
METIWHISISSEQEIRLLKQKKLCRLERSAAQNLMELTAQPHQVPASSERQH